MLGVASTQLKTFKREDGSGTSIGVEHQIALQPSVAIWVRYVEPAKDNLVRVEGEEVVEFAKLKAFQTVTIRVTRTPADHETVSSSESPSA